MLGIFGAKGNVRFLIDLSRQKYFLKKIIRLILAVQFLSILQITFFFPSAFAAAPNAPGFSQAKLEIVVDNDYAAFYGDENNVNQLLYQNNFSWPDQISNATSIDLVGSDTQTYVYIVAMGGGGTEDIGGKLNGSNITTITGAQYASSGGGYLQIQSNISGYNSGAAAGGTQNVTLSDLQSAITGATWSSAVGVAAGSGMPPNYKTSGVCCSGGTRGWDFPSNSAVVFRYPISSLSLPVRGDYESAVVTWTAPSGGVTPTSYSVEYKKTSDSDWTIFSTPNYPITSETVTGLTNGINYSFRVAARNGAEQGPYSAVKNATPTGPPYEPTSLASTVDLASLSASITFTDPKTNGGSAITNYQYSLNGGLSWSALSPADTSSPVTISGLSGGATYSVKLRGLSSLGTGISSDSINVAMKAIVSFDSNGGTGSMSSQSAYGSSNLTSSAFSRAYFSFAGWNTAANGTGTSYANGASYPFTSNSTLYAQWTDTRKTQIISLSGETLDKGSSTTLNATGYLGTGAISYSLQSGDCTLRGSVLTANAGAGTCQVSASIDADATYQAASTSANFTQRTRLAQSITFLSATSMRVDSSTQMISATASSSLTVSLRSATPTICTIASGAVTPLTRGTCTIVASQEGNATYMPASDVSQSFAIQGLPQTITFSQPTSMTTVDDDQAISATSSSGLIVALKTTSTSVCSVSAGMIVPLAEGVCIISAEQSGNSRFEPASAVTRNVTITYKVKSPQLITLEPLLAMRVSDPTQTIQFSTNTSTPITINVSPSEVCSLLTGNKIKAVGAGTCTVQISQVATRRYLASLSSKSFEVVRDAEVRSKMAVQLSWARPFSISQGTALSSAQLNATASVPGTFVYSPAAGTILPRGIHVLTLTFTPEDRTRYLPVTTTVRILVSAPIPATTAAPAISPTPIPTKTIKSDIPSVTVFFKSGSSTVDARGIQVLKEQISLLRSAGIFAINIAGYTNSLPGQDSMLLSKKRAEAVAEIMLKLEPRLKITLEFLGESSPIASNQTAKGQALNRRVVISAINN